jgi:acyl-CoA dehydrogenase
MFSILSFLLLSIFAIYHAWRISIYISLSIIFWSITVFLDLYSTTANIVSLVILGVVFLLISKSSIRKKLSNKIFNKIKNNLPNISDTEKIAIDSGTIGFEKEILAGDIKIDKWLKKPAQKLTEEEQSFLNNEVTHVCKMVDDWKITNQDLDLSKETWDYLKQNKFFGIVIPKEWGGLGFSATAHSKIISKLASINGTLAATVGVPNSLGPAELLLHHGTEKQKSEYLFKLATGEHIPCFALTGPYAGSDATSLPDYGIITKKTINGAEQIGVNLNINKRYITLAPVATLIGVAFQLHDPDGILGETKELGLTLALLNRATKGLKIGRRHLPLNIAFQNGTIQAKNAWIPIENILGEEKGIGQGWRMLVECLSIGRSITLPSSASGVSKAITLATGAYARIRKQFGISLSNMEIISTNINNMLKDSVRCELWANEAAEAVDSGEKPAILSAMAKAHSTELARNIVKTSMDIHGGKGIMLGPKNYLGRAWQGAPIAITVEGANILTKSLMITGQGIIRCHPFLQKEVQAINENNLIKFDEFFWKHIAHSASLKTKVILQSWLRLPWIGGQKKEIKKLKRYSNILGFFIELVLIKVGGNLKSKGNLCFYVGESWANLFMASAAMKTIERTENKIKKEILKEIINEEFEGFTKNIKLAGVELSSRFNGLLNLMLFPESIIKSILPIKHKKNFTKHLTSDIEFRDIFGENMFLDSTENNQIGILHNNLVTYNELENELIEFNRLFKSIKNPQPSLTLIEKIKYSLKLKLINKNQAEKLNLLAKIIDETIDVDDFEIKQV